MRAIVFPLALLATAAVAPPAKAPPAAAKPGVYWIVPLVAPGPCQPNNGVTNTHDPRPHCPIKAEGPRDPPGWRRVALPTFSMAVPPQFTGGAIDGKSMLFESPQMELRLKDDPHAPHPRCTFGKLCYRDYTRVIGGVETEAATEDWRAAAPSDKRPWREFVVQHNVYGPRQPVIAVEARCSTRELCAGVDTLLKQLRIAETGAPLKAGDRNTPSEPEYLSPAAYDRGAHRRHVAPTPKGWKRFEEKEFSMAVPPGFTASWDGDGEGGIILSVESKALDLTVARSWFLGYGQCSERVPCVRERTAIDGLPATGMWEDWSGLDTKYVKQTGFLWNYTAAVALPARGGPSGRLILEASASCRTRAICEQAKAMMRTIEIH